MLWLPFVRFAKPKASSMEQRSSKRIDASDVPLRTWRTVFFVGTTTFYAELPKFVSAPQNEVYLAGTTNPAYAYLQ